MEYLAHHGIKGQKWGVRRFQNNDGSLTDQGKRRYLSDETKGKIKKAAKVAGGVAGAAALGYGIYKVGRAGNRLKYATAYKQASSMASNLSLTNRQNAESMLKLRDDAARVAKRDFNAGQYRHASRFYLQRANEYTKDAKRYMRESTRLAMKASELKFEGKRSDQLAYKFVESIIKDPKLDMDIFREITKDL